jgi:predicted lipid-binding transport protein (Tim44 family)
LLTPLACCIASRLCCADVCDVCAEAYAAIERAFKDKDLKALNSFLTPEFHTLKKGDQSLRKNYAEMQAMFVSQFAALETKSWPRRINSLRISHDGKRAVADTQGDFLFVMDGKLQPVVVTKAEDFW